jgi:hypothetical protein
VLRGDYDQPGFVVEMENVGRCSAPTTHSHASSSAGLRRPVDPSGRSR